MRSATFMVGLAVILADVSGGRLRGQTSDFLNAPVAKSLIRLQLPSSDSKTLQWDIPETAIDFQTLTANKPFLTPQAVTITYLKLNPLRMKLKASSKTVQDPGAATMDNLLMTFLNMVNVNASGSPGLAEAIKAASAANSKFSAAVQPSAPLHPCASFSSDLRTLRDNLEAAAFSPKEVGSAVKGWADEIDRAFAIDGTNGPAAIGRGVTAVNTSITGWKTPIKKAEDAIKSISACADSTVETPNEVAEATDPGVRPPDPAKLPTPLGANATAADVEKSRQQVETYVKQTKDLEDWQKKTTLRRAYIEYLQKKTIADNLTSMRLLAITVMVGGHGQRIAEMKTVVAKAGEVLTQLAEFAKTTAWTITKAGNPTTDYVLLRGVTPTFAEMDQVTIEVTTLTYPVDSDTGAFSIAEAKPISSTLTVRRFSRFAIEPAVGAVFATVTQPQYGTGTNDKGQTIVSRSDDKKLSFSPSAMVNFVCRCGTSMISPMLQLGAAASKDTPGALVGAGLRLFGSKTGLGIGGGAMFAWVKDLQALRVGQVVSGTAAIDADRGFRVRPSVGGYFSIQYQF